MTSFEVVPTFSMNYHWIVVEAMHGPVGAGHTGGPTFPLYRVVGHVIEACGSFTAVARPDGAVTKSGDFDALGKAVEFITKEVGHD